MEIFEDLDLICFIVCPLKMDWNCKLLWIGRANKHSHWDKLIVIVANSKAYVTVVTSSIIGGYILSTIFDFIVENTEGVKAWLLINLVGSLISTCVLQKSKFVSTIVIDLK